MVLYVTILWYWLIKWWSLKYNPFPNSLVCLNFSLDAGSFSAIRGKNSQKNLCCGCRRLTLRKQRGTWWKDGGEEEKNQSEFVFKRDHTQSGCPQSSWEERFPATLFHILVCGRLWRRSEGSGVWLVPKELMATVERDSHYCKIRLVIQGESKAGRKEEIMSCSLDRLPLAKWLLIKDSTFETNIDTMILIQALMFCQKWLNFFLR